MEERSGMREAGSTVRKPIQHYRDIEAYQRAKALLAPVHALVRRLPREEQFELARFREQEGDHLSHLISCPASRFPFLIPKEDE